MTNGARIARERIVLIAALQRSISNPGVNGGHSLRPCRRRQKGSLLFASQPANEPPTLFSGATPFYPLERASCARAWKELEEQKRILRGKLKPGSINARTDAPTPKPTRQVPIMSLKEVAEAMRREAAAAPT